MHYVLKNLRDFELQSTGKWFVLAGMIGVVAGVGAIAFQFLGQAVHHYTLTTFAGFPPGEASGEYHFFEEAHDTAIQFRPWMTLLIMTLGGLASGALVYSLAPEAEGHGTDAAIDSFHNRQGMIRGRIPVVKTLASAITLGTGGSAGREGPIAQIGAGFGSMLATKLGLSSRDRRILLAAGMGAGVGAIFRAPLAGALFAGEILYRDADLEADVIVPSAVSSSVAYCVFSLSLPQQQRFAPLFGRDMQFEVASWIEMLPYTALALVLVLAGVVYVKTFYGVHRLFKRIPVLPHIRPAIGAALAGAVGLGLYYAYQQDPLALATLGSGYGVLQQTFTSGPGAMSVPLLLSIASLKVITTSFTISSGGSGGVFGPSMVIGGCLGGAVGNVFHTYWPAAAPSPQAFAIVGMAGFFAGCARAPFSTILMVSEMTGDYKLLLPTMWVAVLCFSLSSRWTLYIKQVPTRLDSPAHRGDFLIDVLEGMRVEDVFREDSPRLIKVDEAATLDEIVHMLATTSQRYFPVLNAAGEMVGIFSAEDVREYTYDDTIWQLADANDVMTTRVMTVTPDDDLNTTLTHFTALNIDELPVVDVGESSKLLGMVRRKEVIAAYNKRLMEHKRQVRESA